MGWGSSLPLAAMSELYLFVADPGAWIRPRDHSSCCWQCEVAQLALAECCSGAAAQVAVSEEKPCS